MIFSTAQGLSAVALPLLALQAGYSAVMVGVLTALSAVAQLACRPFLGRVMRVVPDWTLLLCAAVCLALSSGIAAISAALVPFAVAQALQGVARACFWTGSQTHVVRGPGSSFGALALVNLHANGGALLGPLLAGFLSGRLSIVVALAVGAAISAAGIVPAVALDRLPPFAPRADRVARPRAWRRPGVDVGCWAGVSAGAWRGLMSSYVPVILVTAAYSETAIGVFVAVANGATLLGSGLSGRVRHRWLTAFYAFCTLATGIATIAVAVIVGAPVVVAAALLLAGLGAGGLQTIGPAIASDAVEPEERGDAITVSGTFRAAALFVAPLFVAGLVTVLPVAAALGAAGAAMLGPALASRRLHAHLRSEPIEETDGVR
ncbi:MFS transporter [Actinophytocola sp.]|uniref:MFS transporter n=1 Tax=Actinophytocola sp. TaxID=1872138 RepID=UPI003D6BAA98